MEAMGRGAVRRPSRAQRSDAAGGQRRGMGADTGLRYLAINHSQAGFRASGPAVQAESLRMVSSWGQNEQVSAVLPVALSTASLAWCFLRPRLSLHFSAVRSGPAKDSHCEK